MKSAVLATVFVGCLLWWTPFAVADDVNRTGQSQTDDSGKQGAATPGRNADTMGGGNATATSQSQQPQQPPAAGESPGEAKMNADKSAPLTKH